jgi:hypothetical protein
MREEAVLGCLIETTNLMQLIEKDKGSLKKRGSKERENLEF